jgi:hypothetical protein
MIFLLLIYAGVDGETWLYFRNIKQIFFEKEQEEKQCT